MQYLRAGKAAANAVAASASVAEETAAVAEVVRLRSAAALYTQAAGESSIVAIDFMAPIVRKVMRI